MASEQIISCRPSLPKRPSLPVRSSDVTDNISSGYKIINLRDLKVIEDRSFYTIVISKDDLDVDMSLFKEVIKKPSTIICFKDYESIKYIDSILDERIDNKVSLLDDGLLLDRSYIDLTIIKNMDVALPITYAMWGPKVNDKLHIYELKNKDTDIIGCFSSFYNNRLDIDILKRIRSMIIELDKMNAKTDIEKVYLVSDYIQSMTQYIDGYESVSMKGTIVCPKFKRNKGEVGHSTRELVNFQYGICGPISQLSNMLMNNDVMRIESEMALGQQHYWNRVLVDGRYYNVDNTWNITRSKNSPEDALITYSFNNDYLLFGSYKADEIGHHSSYTDYIYKNGEDATDDYEKIDYESSFDYLKYPKYYTYKK